MTSLPPGNPSQHDPLITLWQSAPKGDTHNLAHEIQRLTGLHRRLSRTVLAVLCGVALLLGFEEWTGRLVTHGVLTAVWTAGLVIGVAWHRRTRCNRAHKLDLDTVTLLKAMIVRARKDLFLARCLYAGVPCGAVAGFLLLKVTAKFTDVGAASGTSVASPKLAMAQTGAGMTALGIMIVAGLVLARSRSVQVRELREKLRSIEADL